MLALIIGGSGSGKSEFAENLCMKLEQDTKLYIATMYVWDEESKARIKRHREIRKDKRFDTMECPYGLKQQLIMEEELPSTALLECMSNLVANEMYCEGGFCQSKKRDKEDETTGADEPLKQELVENIVDGIKQLTASCNHTVIVSNDVFLDGCEYSIEMQEYLWCMGEINKRIVLMADLVAEVVCGIPVIRKGEMCDETIVP